MNVSTPDSSQDEADWISIFLCFVACESKTYGRFVATWTITCARRREMYLKLPV